MTKYLQSGSLDNDRKRGSISVPVDNAIIDADFTTLYDAIEAVQVGTMDDGLLVERTVKESGAQTTPADKNAQRTNKWLITMQGSGENKVFQFTIPCADLSIKQDGSPNMDVSGGAGAALVTALEANVFSPAGNAATFVSAIQVSTSGQ